MHTHQLLDHPLFEERPLKDILEPFGFEVSVKLADPPIDPFEDDPEAIGAYECDPQAYINGLTFEHPAGFTEVDRSENDEGDIYSVAVRAKTVFAQLLLCADSVFAGANSNSRPCYIDVYLERMRQLTVEGFSREHDVEHDNGDLAAAASAYALNAADQLNPYSYGDGNNEIPVMWPWDPEWWKPSTPRRDLVKAGALILAEIERIDRAAERQGGE